MKKKTIQDKTILHTGIICPSCQEVLVSLYGHDFNMCGCGETFIDGGFDYIRTGGKKLEDLKRVKVRITKCGLTSPPKDAIM